MKIKIKTSHDIYNDIDYYTTFTILDELPEDYYYGESIVSVSQISPDIEDATHNAEQYNYYSIATEDEDGASYNYHIAVLKDEEERFV